MRRSEVHGTVVVGPPGPPAIRGAVRLIAAGPALAVVARWRAELAILERRSPGSDAVVTLADCVKELTAAIHAGHDLLIPAGKGTGYALNQAPGTDTARSATREGRKLIYSVRSGDTLWDIARRHDVELDHLAQWNSLSPRDPLRVGQRLSIWQTADRADDNLDAPRPASTTKRIKYVVRKGDSLARISQRFNVKISELRDWNSLRTNDYLQPGQKLTLYIAVTTLTENI